LELYKLESALFYCLALFYAMLEFYPQYLLTDLYIFIT